MASSIVLEVLQIIDNMKEESNLLNDVEGDLAELKQTLLRIQSVLSDGEKREMIEQPVRRWLREVKDAAYYAEDFFDDWRDQRRNTQEVCCPTASLSDRIKKINETLRKIASEIDNLSLKVGVDNGTVKPMAHVRDGSHDVESAVFGREDEKERIIEFLLSARVRRNSLSVVSIVGAPGAGKSTLAELIYGDQRVCEHFERMGWVCVSQDFNLLSITSSLVKSLGNNSVDSEDLAYLLQEFVKQYLVDTRFLLVFDDVWNVDKRRWEILQSPLTVGLEGSAIIITTREKSVAAIMKPVQTYVLGCIAEEKAFPMLETLICESFYRLEEWIGAKDGAFPCLRYLKFGSCFNLKRLTCCFPLLQKLVIWDCLELTVLPAVPSLAHLELNGCNKEIWSSLPQELLNRLLVLGISGSEDLPSLPFQNLSSLKKLEIDFCQKHARNNSSLGLHHLMFLECLKVSYCPNLWFAQEDLLPPTLKELNIFRSPLLATWCRSHARSKLQYVSEIIIDKRELYPTDEESVNDEVPC